MSFKTQLFDALHTCGLALIDSEELGTSQLFGFYPVGDCVRLGWGDDNELNFPDQEVEIDAEGVCLAKDEEGDTYTLRIQMLRPINRADIQAWKAGLDAGNQP